MAMDSQQVPCELQDDGVKTYNSKWCSAINCTNSKMKRPELAFFSFPLDPDRSKRWVINSRRADLEKRPAEKLHQSNVMCEEHFEFCCFKETKGGRKLLKKDSVPTLFAVPNPPPKQTPSRQPPKERSLTTTPPKASTSHTPLDSPGSEIVGDEQIDSDSILLTNSKLKRKLMTVRTSKCRLKKKLKTMPSAQTNAANKPQSDIQAMKGILAEYLPSETLELVMTQLRMAQVHKQGRRWTASEKSFALALFNTSRKAYMMVKKKLYLPSPKTLSNIMKNIHLRPGMCHQVQYLFKMKVASMSDEEKLCAVVIDEMALKKSLSYDCVNDEIEGLEDFGSLGRTQSCASEALVVMVRGIVVKWKQPLAYFLSSGPTKTSILFKLVKDTIANVVELGLIPKVLIWDQGSNNRAVMKKLGVNKDRPYFFINDTKVFPMYDPPHLMNSIRNNLKKSGFSVEGKPVSWEFIQKLYESDSSLPIRMVPKLTKKHITMPPFSNLSVKLAVQVLSHSVAAGITTMIHYGALPSEATATANFAEEFDTLFNCFNSSSLRGKSPMSHGITPSSGHVEFLQGKLTWLDGVICRNRTGKLPCVEGWKLTISCLLELWKDLSTNFNLRFLLTNRLNQDCLENMFSVVRGKGGHRVNPDCREFRSALSQIIVDAILLYADGSNCEVDTDNFLFQLDNIVAKGGANIIKTRLSQDVPKIIRPLLHSCANSSVLKAPEKDIVGYIAGYVASKLDGVVCSLCKIDLVGGESEHFFLSVKQYGDCKSGGLTVPSDVLHQFLQVAERIFREGITSLRVTSGVRFKMLKRLTEATQHIPLYCKSEKNCAVKFLILNLYTTIRLHHFLKCHNRDITEGNRRGIKRKAATFAHI